MNRDRVGTAHNEFRHNEFPLGTSGKCPRQEIFFHGSNTDKVYVIFLRGHSVLSVVTTRLTSFTLLTTSQRSHQMPGIPEFPTVHEQSFIRLAPFPLDSLESPQL